MRELLQALGKEADPCLNREFRNKIKNVCASYLGGIWSSLPLEKLHLSRLTGATSNVLFLCKISDDSKTNNKEPTKVLLRLYFKPDKQNNIVDTIVFTLLSERDMGPKLHGVFNEGRIEQYIESRSLTTNELAVPCITSEIARLLAKVHQLEIPILKSPDYLHETLERWLDQLDHNVDKLHKFQTLERFWKWLPKELDLDCLKKEVQHLKESVMKSKSLVMFCHNDLQEGNILLPNEADPKSGLNLVFIDFEYSSYNYRGFDFANHFVEYSISYEIEQAPYYEMRKNKFPNKDQMLHFFYNYLAKIKPEASKDELKLEAESLICESMPFIPCSHLFWSVWGFLQSVTSPLTFGFLEYAQDRLYAYFENKHLLEEFGSV